MLLRFFLCLTLLLPACGSLLDALEGDALKKVLGGRWQTLSARYDSYVDVETQRGNNRRACELINEFKAETLKLCRLAHDRGLRSTCEEDGRDYLPYDCSTIRDAEPFSLQAPGNPLG